MKRVTPILRMFAGCLLGMVAVGEGVAILAELATRGLRGRSGFLTKALDLPQPQFQVVAVWNPALPSVALSRYLALLVRRTAPPHQKRVAGKEDIRPK